MVYNVVRYKGILTLHNQIASEISLALVTFFYFIFAFFCNIERVMLTSA